MSTSPRSRKRAREEGEQDVQVAAGQSSYLTHGNGNVYGSSNAQASTSGQVYGYPQVTSERGSASPAPTPTSTTSAQQQPPPSPPIQAASAETHSTRPARFDRKDRPLSKETLDQSFFCVEPHDEFTREVGDWIWGWIHNRTNVEIEAKIGLLVDNRPGLPVNTRVSFPLGTETILTDATFARFASNMTLRQHHHFNQILNAQVGEANRPEWAGAPIRYIHTKEVDAFHPHPGGAAGRTKIRVTRDEKDKNRPGAPAKACVEKTRVADMNIFSPKRGFDFRISISVETPVPLPTTRPSHERYKNRVSYQHQAFQVDLTQVKAADAKETLHELEIEFSDMPLLMQEGYKKDTEEGSLYYDLVQVFLNNIRMLIRNAAPP